ncbi:MAG TPA: hypothetical protein VFN67_33405 [Polyangiales bacterium]|nr:hypothetical protein [Polyangiales bacterium]
MKQSETSLLSRALSAALVCVVGACAAEAADPEKSALASSGQASSAATAPQAGGAATSQAPGATATRSAGPAATTTGVPNTPSGTQPGAAASQAAPAAAALDTAAGSDSGTVLPCAVSTSLATNCQNCHGATPIGGAPMPLVTYADLMKPSHTQPGKKVYELVQTRIHDEKSPMPPIGRLPPSDMSALDAWLSGGVPAGTASDATCAASTTKSTGDVTGRDLGHGEIIPTAEETCYKFKVHGSTTSVDDTKFNIEPGELYEQFYYKVPWPAGTIATAYATLGDNEQVLHHWLLFSTNEQQQEGAHITAPLPTLIGTDPILLAGWAAGGPNVSAPQDVGFELPDPGATINVQWHFYNSTSAPQSDGSTLQICTVPRAARKNIANVTWAGTEDLNGNVWFGGAGMPPHQESTFTTTCVPGRKGLAADQSIHIFSFEPHMHRLGKRMQTWVKRATGGDMQMVFDQPFNFGSETHYPTELELKPGDSLVTSCTFNNDTDKGVPFGESTDTEMCYQFTWAYPAHSVSNGASSILGVTDTCW